MQTDHDPNEAVREAALYLAGPRERTGEATIPDLRSRFGISTMEAIEAIRLANSIRDGGRNNAVS